MIHLPVELESFPSNDGWRLELPFLGDGIILGFSSKESGAK